MLGARIFRYLFNAALKFRLVGHSLFETFEKCSILVKIKKGDNFNHRNILNISRIEI